MDFRVKQPNLRILVRPEQRLRSLAERALETQGLAERIAGRAAARLRPALASLFAVRRRLATSAVALLTVWLLVHVMFGANGMVVYRQKKDEYQSLQKEIDALQKENDSYAAAIKSLKTDPKTIEKEAREQLHYARPGEVIFVAPAPIVPQRPLTDAARK
jgi:cell division protein FtsB